MKKRRVSKEVSIGKFKIGAKNLVRIQSMCNSKTQDAKSTIKQIKDLENIGCEIIRVSVPDNDSADNISIIKKNIDIPLVVDIHFDHKLAIKSIKNGCDKVRINPGNIGSEKGIKSLLEIAKDRNIPIRIGVNSGSLDREILMKYGKICGEALSDSALKHIRICEKYGFEDIVISLKSSSVKVTVDAYRDIAKKINYPLHLGVTECGTEFEASIKSAMGIGALLMDGIGDTIRVSVTGSPLLEIPIAKSILAASERRIEKLNIISCPTCARCDVDLEKLVNKVSKATSHLTTPIDVAIMGCVVNGPGEARGAHIGIAGAKNELVLFEKGKVTGRYKEHEIEKVLIERILEISSQLESERQ